MTKVWNWVKSHKLLTFVIAVVVAVGIFISLVFLKFVFGYMRYGGRDTYYSSNDSGYMSMESKGIGSMSTIAPVMMDIDAPVFLESAGSPGSQEERMITTDSNFALLVKNIDQTVDNIKKETVSMGGFVVDSYIYRYDDMPRDDATVEVRVPTEKLDEFSKYLKDLAVRVTFERINGTDITDQYTDYEKKLESLEAVNTRLQEIMNEAKTVEDIMNVQNRIFSIQDQIDSVKGQIDYMKKSAETSRVTISLSTDEVALPYAPKNAWRPEAVFRGAVRALISVVRFIGTIGIWIVVFSPLAILVVAVRYLLRKRKK